MLSPADTPTLSPAGPSPSPGGVSFSPYGSSTGVSPAGAVPFGAGQGGSMTISPSGSTAVSPATCCSKVSIGSGYSAGAGGGYGGGGYHNPPRCSIASATEEMDQDATEGEENEERFAMGLAPLGEGRPSSLGIGGGAGGAAPVGGPGARGGCDADVSRLFEMADELGGQGASGLRWSELAIFDDQVRGLLILFFFLLCVCMILCENV